MEHSKGDLTWSVEIKQFWDCNMPIALSVDDGYAYFAMRADGQIVHGREPEYEDVEVFATSFSDFLKRIGATRA